MKSRWNLALAPISNIQIKVSLIKDWNRIRYDHIAGYLPGMMAIIYNKHKVPRTPELSDSIISLKVTMFRYYRLCLSIFILRSHKCEFTWFCLLNPSVFATCLDFTSLCKHPQFEYEITSTSWKYLAPRQSYFSAPSEYCVQQTTPLISFHLHMVLIIIFFIVYNHLQRQCARNFYQASQLCNSSEKVEDKKIKCTLIPGDGVGPELVNSVKEVFSAIGVPIEFEELFLRYDFQTIHFMIKTE